MKMIDFHKLLFEVLELNKGNDLPNDLQVAVNNYYIYITALEYRLKELESKIEELNKL